MAAASVYLPFQGPEMGKPASEASLHGISLIRVSTPIEIAMNSSLR